MKSFLITDRDYYTNNVRTFRKNLIDIFSKNVVDFAIFRDKDSKNVQDLAKEFSQACTIYNVKGVINTHLEVAKKLDFTHIHLNYATKHLIKEAKDSGMSVIFSTHSKADIEQAIENGCDYALFSPIFATPNKGEPKGIDELKQVVKNYDIKVIALGGIIKTHQLKDIYDTGCYGFASIRYFTYN